MALAPTLYDFDVTLSHVDRSFEQRLKLRPALHPSESRERLWLRVIAYCWLWDERIAFGPGLSEADSPDLVSTDLTGGLTQWIRVGKADPAKIRHAVRHHPAAKVAVLFESPSRMEAFLGAAQEQAIGQLSAVRLAAVDSALLAELAAEESRRTQLSLTIVGDHLYIDRGGRSLDGPLALRSAP